MAVSSFSKIVDKLVFGFAARLRDYEERCLKDAFKSVGEPERQILEAQLGALERVQRFNSDRQVNLFFGSNAPRFPNTGEDLRLARLSYRDRHGERFRVTVVSHRGLLSSLEYSGLPPRANRNLADLLDVRIISDPGIVAQPGTPAVLSAKRELSALMDMDLGLEDVEGPATKEEIERLRADVGTIEDLEQLVRISNGWTCRGWRFHGTRLRGIPRAGKKETLLAVAEGPIVAIGLGADTGNRWIHYDGVDEDEMVVERDLVDVIRETLRSQRDKS